MVTDTQIKTGYKQTELGVIPNDWEILEVMDATISHKQGYYTKDRYMESGVSLVRITDLHNPKIDYAAMPALRISKRDFDLYKINVGDFLFARSGAIGRYGIVHEKVDAIFGSYIIRFVFDSSKLINEYFGFVYETDVIWKQLLSITQGSSNININATNIKSLKVAIPPQKEEQSAIITSLSDADVLIEHLDKMIAKKKAIKQGTMQQLLTGKKRLPGFSGEWKVRELGEIAEIKTGKKNNDDKVEEGLYPFFVRSQQVERIDSYSFEGEAILIPGEGNIGSIYHYINGRFDYHQRVYKISNFAEQYSGKFIYLFMSQHFNVHAMKNSVKATVDSLRLPTFQEFEIFFPPTKAEQTAIANILSDMDKEIKNIAQKRDKYRMLKQGMMQQLLTGKIRLL